MERQHIFAVIAAVATANGIFSPDLIGIVALAPLWYPDWLMGDAGTLFMLSSLLWATTTLMLGGVPAALMERAVPAVVGGTAPLWVWLGGVTLLSLSGLQRMVAITIG